MKRVLAAVLALGALAGTAVAQKPNIVIGTGSTGGVFFFYGQSLADILNRAGVANAQATQTGGSYDNILLLRDRTDAGSNTFYCALTTTDAALVTYQGTEPRFAQRKADTQRVMFYMYPSLIHVVTTSATGIDSFADLRGKRVSTGQPGSSTENLALLLLEGAGIKPDQFSRRERLPAAESARALSEGTIDAYFWVGGVPTSSVVEVSQSLQRRGQRLVFLDVPPQGPITNFMRQKFPGVVQPTTIPAATYGTAAAVLGLNTGNVLTCPSSMPEPLAYAITKAVFDNINTLRTAVAAARDTTPQATARIYSPRAAVPFHPGAVRYWRETGAIK